MARQNPEYSCSWIPDRGETIAVAPHKPCILGAF